MHTTSLHVSPTINTKPTNLDCSVHWLAATIHIHHHHLLLLLFSLKDDTYFTFPEGWEVEVNLETAAGMCSPYRELRLS